MSVLFLRCPETTSLFKKNMDQTRARVSGGYRPLMLAYSDAPRVAERFRETTAMDATALTSSIKTFLAQTESFTHKSPNTRQALLIQCEQMLAQSMYVLTELKLWPPLRAVADPFTFATRTEECATLWLALDQRYGALYVSLPESMQEALDDTMAMRAAKLQTQYAPHMPEHAPQEPNRQPLPFRPRPRPTLPETPVLPVSGFQF